MGVKIKKRNGAWWVFIHYRRQRKAKRVGSKKAAELVALKIQARLAEGDISPLKRVDDGPGPITFKAYATAWLVNHAEQACKFSTIRIYKANLRRHVFPALGAKQLGSLNRADCRSLIAACRDKTLGPKSIANICRTLSSVLSQAVEDGRLPANPAFRLGRYYRRVDQAKPQIFPLTRDEVATFLKAARHYAPREYPLFLCAVRTGMRLGELLGLQWGDVDFNGRFIEIRRNRVAGRLTTPKSGKTRRVDMSAQLTETLRTLLTARKTEALSKGWGQVPDWVFCSEDGRPLDGDNLRHRVFYRVLAKAGLRRLRFHDLRHTFASLLIQNGESLAYVRDQLGHASIQLTVDTYGHLVPGANRQAVDRLDDAEDAAKRNPEPPTKAHGN